MAEIIDGKALSARLREKLCEKVRACGKKITLAVVLVGSDGASQVYVRNKIKACAEVGIVSRALCLPDTATECEICELVRSLADDESVDGILVQLPLPAHVDTRRVLSLIPPEKDVDGFTAVNAGKLFLGEKCLAPCTPSGVMEMLRAYNIDPRGKRAVVLGRSEIVGKPMAQLLLNADATVTVCHSKTADIKGECLKADILVSAVGKAGFVTADMVKDGAVVIDVGMNRGSDGRLCGDADFEGVKEKCSHITPVPGGVGPMTITMLLYNTYTAATEND